MYRRRGGMSKTHDGTTHERYQNCACAYKKSGDLGQHMFLLQCAVHPNRIHDTFSDNYTIHRWGGAWDCLDFFLRGRAFTLAVC